MSASGRDELADLRATLERVLARVDGGEAMDLAEARALASALEDAVASAPAAPNEEPSAPTRRLVHDLRSAGGTLLTWAHLLRRGGLPEAQIARAIDVIERSARRHIALAEQLARTRTAESAAPASGAAVAVARREEPEHPTSGADAGLRGLRILIVDDDAEAREGMRALLTAQGADVVTAISAIDAFDVLQQGRPDLLISDIVMPDADGYALLRRVRAPDTGERGLIPAIAVTGRAYAGDRQRALGAGYQVHLTKPLEPSELLRAVRVVTGR